MSRRPPHLGRDRRGATAVEFALIAPVLIAFLLGVAQLGVLFFANAGLQNALAEGARLATIFPRPSEAAVAAKITQQRFGLDPARLTDPSFAYGTTNGMSLCRYQPELHDAAQSLAGRNPADYLDPKPPRLHPAGGVIRPGFKSGLFSPISTPCFTISV